MSEQRCENYDVKRETVHCYPRNGDRSCGWSEVAWCCRWNLSWLRFPHWSFGEQWILMFPGTKSRKTLRFEGNKIHCSPRDQSLSDLLYWKTKQRKFLKPRWDSSDNIRPPLITCKISRVTVNCFPFDVIVFATLPAHGIWWETGSLLDVMWP